MITYKKKYYCAKCNIQFEKKKDFNNHNKDSNDTSHKAEMIFTCLKCNKDFKSMKTLDKHNSVICNLKPIVKWSGGKYDELKHISEHIPNSYNYYIEPFVGGGSVLFSLLPDKSVINDVHKELIDLYNSIKKGKSDDIYQFMSENQNTEENYYNIRDNMVVETELDNAKRFYYLRKTCYRGMLRYNKQGKFNIPYGKYKHYNYENLKNPLYYNILKNCNIYNVDFSDIFNKYNDENNFMFLDPPYDSEFTDYGYCSFGKQEQEKLAKCFKETKIKCLMIIGKTPYIEKLYKGYIKGEYDKKYRFKLHSGRVGNEINTKHLIIKNY